MDPLPDPDTDETTRRTTIKALGGLGATAAGLSTADTAAAHDGDGHLLSVIAKDATTAYYEFSVDGEVTKARANDATLNDYDTVDASAVIGRTTRERDAYEFEGVITEFYSSAPLEVTVDGTRIDLASVSEGVDDDADIDNGETADDETEVESESEDEPEPEDDTSHEIDASDYDEVVDITDAGADPTGSSSIHGVLDDVLDSATLVTFPPGTYRMAEGVRITNEGRIGMLGNDATLIHDDGRGTLCKLGTYKDPNEVVEVEGFTGDLSRSSAGGRVFECHATESLYVGDIQIEGQHSTGNKGPLAVGLQSPSGEGLVESYEAPDGGEDVSSGYGGTGLLVSNYHEGTVTLRDCHIGPFPDNGIYCSNGTPPNHQGGTVHVKDGLVENANVAGVRLAGEGSTIDGTQFVYDRDISGFGGQRPIRVDWGSGLEISNVDIQMSDVSITEAIRVMDGVDSVDISNVTGDLTSSVRDAISVTSSSTDVDTSGIDFSGFSRYNIFNY